MSHIKVEKLARWLNSRRQDLSRRPLLLLLLLPLSLSPAVSFSRSPPALVFSAVM
jgi:hypothetical protein